MRGLIIGLALLAGCATVTTIDRATETRALSADIQVPVERVRFTSRCHYVLAPKGAISAGELLNGVCFITDEGLHIRVIDVTTGKGEFLGSFKRSEIESLSRVPHAIYEQLQIRTRTHIIALYMRPDGGMGLNWEASNKFIELLKALGIPEVEASARINFVPAGGARGVPIPIFIPRGR